MRPHHRRLSRAPRRAARGLPVVALALSAVASGARAQAPRPLPDSGAVLRLDAPSLELSGRAVTLDARWGDTLVVLDPKGAGRTGVPLSLVRRVDVRVGEARGGAGRGARVGLLVGVITTGVLVTAGVAADRDCRDNNDDFCGFATVAGATIGALFTGVTTGLGAIIGHYQHENQWEPVWAPPRTSLRAVPVVTGRGVGLALGGRF